MKPIAVTQVVKQGKRAKYFGKDCYPDKYAFEPHVVDPNDSELIPEEGENIPRGRVGTMVDLLTRAHLVESAADEIFNVTKEGWDKYKADHKLSDDKVFEESLENVGRALDYEVPVSGLPENFFQAGEWLAEFANIRRSNGRVFTRPEDEPGHINQTTINHVKQMLARAEAFFTAYGEPTQANFHVAAQYDTFFGDGDYLTPKHLIDFKVSMKDPRDTTDYRLQVGIYYALGKEEHQYSEFETIKDLILFNPRTNTAYVADVNNEKAHISEIQEKIAYWEQKN